MHSRAHMHADDDDVVVCPFPALWQCAVRPLSGGLSTRACVHEMMGTTARCQAVLGRTADLAGTFVRGLTEFLMQ